MTFLFLTLLKKKLIFQFQKKNQALYNILPKDYKSKKEKLKKEIYKKYILDSTKNNTKNKHIQNTLEII